MAEKRRRSCQDIRVAKGRRIPLSALTQNGAGSVRGACTFMPRFLLHHIISDHVQLPAPLRNLPRGAPGQVGSRRLVAVASVRKQGGWSLYRMSQLQRLGTLAVGPRRG